MMKMLVLQNKNETLVLGHMPGESDAMYDFEDDRVPTRNRKKQEMIFGALVENIARRYVNGYSYEGVDRKEEFIK